MKIRRTHLIAAATTSLAVALLASAYLLGRYQADAEVRVLTERVDSLKLQEKDAVIVKRVSQQMEEIAYQQMEVANLNRDQALQQQQIALENAARAERESAAAHESRNEAIAAQNLAEEQRNKAIEQEMIAWEERDEATLAKNIADTLSYRTQAKTVATVSSVERAAGRVEVSDILAYISWYFSKNYRGNTYYSPTFRALEAATHNYKTHVTAHKGMVNALSVIPGSKGKCVAATNMGELEIFDVHSNASQKLMYNSQYDFRDIHAEKNAVYALSFNGPLCIVDYAGKVKEVPLDKESYFKLIKANDNSFILAGRRSIRWYNISSGQVSSAVKLPGKLNAIVKREQVYCLFYADGKYAEMDATGKITEKTPIAPYVVTAASYDPIYGCLSIGVSDGTTYILNKYNRICEVLSAHQAQVTSVSTHGIYQLSTSYDKTMYLWKLDNLYFSTGLTYAQEMKTKTATVMKTASKTKQKVDNEWISPVEYKFSSWTTAVTGDLENDIAWMGTAGGEVACIHLSADKMAALLHSQLKRELTNAEWARYIGTSIPYMQFK